MCPRQIPNKLTDSNREVSWGIVQQYFAPIESNVRFKHALKYKLSKCLK